jgi:hypothetical protein
MAKESNILYSLGEFLKSVSLGGGVLLVEMSESDLPSSAPSTCPPALQDAYEALLFFLQQKEEITKHRELAVLWHFDSEQMFSILSNVVLNHRTTVAVLAKSVKTSVSGFLLGAIVSAHSVNCSAEQFGYNQLIVVQWLVQVIRKESITVEENPLMNRSTAELLLRCVVLG